MRRIGYALMLASLAMTGCASPLHFWDQPRPPAKTAPAKPVDPATVTADQVNDANARQMAESLLDEMDRDAQGRAPPSVEPTRKP